MVILKRMYSEFFLDEYFNDWKDSDEEDFFDSSDNFSFFGWNFLFYDFDDFDVEFSDEDGLYF